MKPKFERGCCRHSLITNEWKLIEQKDQLYLNAHEEAKYKLSC